MKRGKDIDKWFPFWIDKWILGSTRLELILEEDGKFIDLRGIWIDLLTLSKKDDGYIRANETIPYNPQQLAGLLCVPIERLEQTITLCLKYRKLEEKSLGIYYVPSTKNYELSERWKREFKRTSENKEVGSEKTEAKEEEKRVNKKREEEKKARAREDTNNADNSKKTSPPIVDNFDPVKESEKYERYGFTLRHNTVDDIDRLARHLGKTHDEIWEVIPIAEEKIRNGEFKAADPPTNCFELIRSHCRRIFEEQEAGKAKNTHKAQADKFMAEREKRKQREEEMESALIETEWNSLNKEEQQIVMEQAKKKTAEFGLKEDSPNYDPWLAGQKETILLKRIEKKKAESEEKNHGKRT